VYIQKKSKIERVVVQGLGQINMRQKASLEFFSNAISNKLLLFFLLEE
jgi:hypothetical protein